MVKLDENIPMKGIFELKVYRSGKLIEKIEEHNLVVNGAKAQMARLIAGNVSDRNINRIAFGTNGIEPELTDTLITGQWTKQISGFAYPGNGRVQFNWELLVTENNGMAIREFGLLTGNGTLFSRKTRVTPIHKAPDISLNPYKKPANSLYYKELWQKQGNPLG
jgi:hypothetical protein